MAHVFRAICLEDYCPAPDEDATFVLKRGQAFPQLPGCERFQQRRQAVSLVRFASRCDVVVCGARSPEYTEWPLCRADAKHVCPQHQRPETVIDADERGVSCICTSCDPNDDPHDRPPIRSLAYENA